MKTLLIYQSKNGATREIANRIAALLGDTVVHDLKDGWHHHLIAMTASLSAVRYMPGWCQKR
jgi:menaquinone-dependent protoporphyrinogen IX oxidase